MARYDTDRDDRGFFDRAADEARSWFGDDDAERRRRRDHMSDRFNDSDDDGYRRSFESGDDPDRRSREGYSSGRFSSEDRGAPRGGQRRDGRNYGDYDYGRPVRSSGQEYRGEDRDRALYAPTGSGMSDYSTNRGSGMDRGYDRTGDYSGGTYDRGYGSGNDYRSSNDYRSGNGYRSDAGYRSGNDYGSNPSRTSHAGRGPQGYSRSTDRITEDVNECLMDDHGVDATNVQVSVDDGEVTLEGTVRSRAEKRRAEDIAERVRGVRDVHNRLRVSTDETPGQQVNAVMGSGDTSGNTSSAKGAKAS